METINTEIRTSFILSKAEPTKEVAKVNNPKSELVIAKETLITDVKNETVNVSEFFKNFRKASFDKIVADKDGNPVLDKDGNKQYIDSKLTIWVKKAQEKGRRFDAEKIDTIINKGKLKLVTDADDVLQASKTKPAQTWSANRLFNAFVQAVEIKKAVKS